MASIKSGWRGLRAGVGVMALCVMCLLTFAPEAAAQRRLPIDLGGMSDRLINIKVGEITLESINFRDQTARMSVGLDISNGFVPVSLKDFDYRLSLYGREAIEGHYDGTMKIGGRNSSRVNLPVEINIGSIPEVIWSAFRNRGQVRYELETGFTLPLFVTEKRFDKSFAGEVPLKSLVDAASILRASRSAGSSSRDNSPLGGWRW